MQLSRRTFTAAFTLVSFFWTSLVLAQETMPLSYKRGQVPTGEERATTLFSETDPTLLRWSRLPYFQSRSIEIVRAGEVDEFWSPRLTLNGQFKEWMAASETKLSNFEWLQLRELDVSEASVEFDQIQFIAKIPIAFGIRYQTSSIKQGTINVVGVLTVKGSIDGVIDSINLVAFDDGQFLERSSRSLGILSDFDANFIQGLSIPVLQYYFNTDPHLMEALMASGASTSIQNGVRPLD